MKIYYFNKETRELVAYDDQLREVIEFERIDTEDVEVELEEIREEPRIKEEPKEEEPTKFPAEELKYDSDKDPKLTIKAPSEETEKKDVVNKLSPWPERSYAKDL